MKDLTGAHRKTVHKTAEFFSILHSLPVAQIMPNCNRTNFIILLISSFQSTNVNTCSVIQISGTVHTYTKHSTVLALNTNRDVKLVFSQPVIVCLQVT